MVVVFGVRERLGVFWRMICLWEGVAGGYGRWGRIGTIEGKYFTMFENLGRENIFGGGRESIVCSV
jgi:hypothetical protein